MTRRRLVLAGAGHAHLFVLRHFARNPMPALELMLVTPAPFQYYSGMLPGLIAGHYTVEQCGIDLAPLCAAANCRLILGRVAAIDADARRLTLDDSEVLDFDLLSLDIGSETRDEDLLGCGDRLLRVKPLDEFHHRWLDIAASGRERPLSVAVVGAGAAGVELAFSTRHALQRAGNAATVTLVAGNAGLLPGHGSATQRRIARLLHDAGISVVSERALGVADGLLLASGTRLSADVVVAATGARAPAWLTQSRLALDANGFVAVDASHRSLSHGHVFAAGDIAARRDDNFGRSGVHAVRAGPVLAHNLQAALEKQPLITYKPRKRVLYLIACGGTYAVASWGGACAWGRWVWHWKDWIDRRFVKSFSSR